MPIDSRDKRGSIIGFNLPFRRILPVPDPQIEDQGDRQQLDFMYRGILAVNINLFFKGPIHALVADRFRQLDSGNDEIFINADSKVVLDAGHSNIYVNAFSKIRVTL